MRKKKRKDRDFGDRVGEIGGRITEQRRLKENGHGGWTGNRDAAVQRKA